MGMLQCVVNFTERILFEDRFLLFLSKTINNENIL